MKLVFVDVDGSKETIDDNVSDTKAIQEAKNFLEIHFDQDEIDDELFYVTEDEDEDGRSITRVYLIANSFGILSDFYIEITDDSSEA